MTSAGRDVWILALLLAAAVVVRIVAGDATLAGSLVGAAVGYLIPNGSGRAVEAAKQVGPSIVLPIAGLLSGGALGHLWGGP